MEDALRAGYAAVVLPEIVKADMRRFCCITKTPVEHGTDGHVDPLATLFNNGKADAWNTLESRMKQAREPKERQTTAVSTTAETSA